MKEFIKVQNTIIAVDAIISIKQVVTSVGKGRPEDERHWNLYVITAEERFSFDFKSRKEMEDEFESLWHYLES